MSDVPAGLASKKGALHSSKRQFTSLQANATEVAPLTSFDWAPENDARLATSSINNNVVVWDVEVRSCECLSALLFNLVTDCLLNLSTEQVACMVFHNKATLMLQAGKSDAPICVHSKSVYDISFGTDSVLATCSADGSARIMDTRCVRCTT